MMTIDLYFPPGSGQCLGRESPGASAVWEAGGWGDPADRAAERTGLMYSPPRACNTWSGNTYQK